MTAITDITDPRLVKALAHPIRVRILGLLEGRTLTPKQLAAELELPLENVSYHVRTLAKFGLIELKRRQIAKGTVEHYYRTKERPRIGAKTWEQLPPIVQEAMMGAILQQLVQLASQALAHEGFARPECHLSRRPVTLDEAGFAEVSRILSKALDDISAVEKQAAKRLRHDKHEGIRAVAAAMLFEAYAGEEEPQAKPQPKPPRARRTRRDSARRVA
jgi:DNA-binding transcriptional ArsR family regulator